MEKCFVEYVIFLLGLVNFFVYKCPFVLNHLFPEVVINGWVEQRVSGWCLIDSKSFA
jgi:hypothetical protein